MKEAAWITIDIGTSTAKCGIISLDGRLLAHAHAPVGLYASTGIFSFEANPNEWLSSCAAIIRKARADSGVTDLRGIAVSGNGPTLAFADAAGEAVGMAASWMDRSAAEQARRVSRIVGQRIDPGFYLPKILRAIELEPEGRGRAARFFSCPEFIVHALCGEAVAYLPDPYYERFLWSRDAARELGVDGTRLPEYIAPSRHIGNVSSSASMRYGLPSGLPVISAFPDFLSAIVGSGALEPGIVCDRTGTSEAYNLCARGPSPDTELFSLPHAIPGLWNISGGLSTSGKAIEWFSSVSGLGEHIEESGASQDGALNIPVQDKVYETASRSPPGAHGLIFLPYLSGERAPLWSPQLRAAFIGMDLSHERKDLARAVVESMAFGLKLVSRKISESGFDSRLLRVSGTPGRNPILARIKCDILDLPLEIPEISDCELSGNACACAVALGHARDLAEASGTIVHIATRHEPDGSARGIYDETFEAFMAALAAVQSLPQKNYLKKQETDS